MSLQKNPTTGLVIELFGPTLEFMTSPDDEHNDFCALRGTIPPDGYVPLHSHPDTEDFLVISGAVEGLRACLVRFTLPSPAASVSGGSWPPR
jgi:hypothetical protein